MKRFLLILLFFISQLSSAESLDGISSPDKAVKDFFSSLKEGSSGINKALDNITGLNSDSRKYAENEKDDSNSLQNKLQDIIIKQKQGPIVKYNLVSEDVKLNGDMIKREYSIKFKGGQTKTIKFIFIKPVRDGNFHLMDTKLFD